MIIDYDKNPNLNWEQKLRSLRDSVQMAFNELLGNAGTSKQTDDAKTIKSVNSVIEEKDVDGWHYRKWSNGKVEAWFDGDITLTGSTEIAIAHMYRATFSLEIPEGIFSETPSHVNIDNVSATTRIGINASATDANTIAGYGFGSVAITNAWHICLYAVGA